MTVQPAISVRGLRKAYGTTVAVDGIDLDVHEGEVLGILGPNGSGKTTAVECIGGLRRPDAGSIRVLGLDPMADRRALRRTVGIQLQHAGLQAKLTVREALGLYGSFYDEPADGLTLAERVGLGSKLDGRYQDLSGGQQQRLSICLALIGRPRVALLDELSTGLDPNSRRAVWEVVDELRADGVTILLVTHLMEEAERLCDRIAVFDRGRIIAIDTTSGIVGRSSAPTTMSFASDTPVDRDRLGALPGVAEVRERAGGHLQLFLADEAVPEVLEWLRQQGVRPTALRIEDSTLDDAFVDLIHANTSRSLEA